MKIILFILPALTLLATVNEPLRGEFFTGYRNDRLHWHLQLPGDGGELTYEEKDRDVEFWENGLILKNIHQDLVFYLRGSYGAFGRGDVYQRYANLSYTSLEPTFQGATNGWAADTGGYFGYAVNLTDMRTYKVILIPLIGFSAHFERIRRNHLTPKPFESTDAIGASSFALTSSLPSKLHQTWYGFFMGGGFQLEPGGRLNFQAGYSYHFLWYRFKSHLQNQGELFNPAAFSNTITATKIQGKNGGNGHTGWALFDYILSTFWRIGLGAQIHYFSSHVVSVKERVSTTPLLPPSATTTASQEEKLKMRWTSISGWLQASREF